MSNYNKTLTNLEILKLDRIKDNLGNYIDLINDNKKNVVDSLYELTNLELDLRRERTKIAMIKTANFPFLKTFDDFDFSFQPTVNRNKILDFKTFRFIDNLENIIFIGTSGVGKTHLATAIGMETAKARYSTYFITFHTLLANLKKAHLENRLEQRIKHYCRYKVLIIDEVGYLPIDSDASNMFFQLINKRYEKSSTILTTNKPFNKWHEIFGEATIANAILDRLVHHSNIIKITGKSYRLKDALSDLEENKVEKKE